MEGGRQKYRKPEFDSQGSSEAEEIKRYTVLRRAARGQEQDPGNPSPSASDGL